MCREHAAALSAVQNKATSEAEAKDETLAKQTTAMQAMEEKLVQLQANLNKADR